MTATAAQWAATQTGNRNPESRGSRGGGLSRDDLVALAVSVGFRRRNALRFVDHHLHVLGSLDDSAAVLTYLSRHGASIPVDLEAERIASRLAGGASR